jgi:hypothetical protein
LGKTFRASGKRAAVGKSLFSPRYEEGNSKCNASSSRSNFSGFGSVRERSESWSKINIAQTNQREVQKFLAMDRECFT